MINGNTRQLILHEHALKHMSAEDIVRAWTTASEFVERQRYSDPPRWLVLGFTKTGVSVEMVAIETNKGWMIIHANSPATKRFVDEIHATKRRTI